MKNRLFHQLPDTPIRQYRRMLSDLNDELRRAGLPPVKGGRSLRSVQNAYLEASKKVDEVRAKEEEEAARKEEERQRKEFQKYKSKIKSAVSSAKSMDATKDKIRAIMQVLSSEDQDALRTYDSDDIVGIAEVYANVYANSDDMDADMHDAADQYYSQREQAFSEMDSGDYDADFSGVPFF